MRAYLITTGTVFASIVVAHVWRIAVEPSSLDPWLVILTLVAAGFSVWAFSLVRRATHTNS